MILPAYRSEFLRQEEARFDSTKAEADKQHFDQVVWPNTFSPGLTFADHCYEVIEGPSRKAVGRYFFGEAFMVNFLRFRVVLPFRLGLKKVWVSTDVLSADRMGTNKWILGGHVFWATEPHRRSTDIRANFRGEYCTLDRKGIFVF